MSDPTAAVSPKAVSAAVTDSITKIYDGTAAVNPALPLSIPKIDENDDITITAQGAVYDNADAGTDKAITLGDLTVTGAAKNWYTVTAPAGVTGTITEKPLSDAVITITGSYTYTGEPITPAEENVSVQDGAATLENGKDYDYTASNNTNAGTATLTVTFKGNYCDRAEQTFTIAKTAGSIAIIGDPAKTYDGTAASEPAVDVNGSDGTVSFAWYEGETQLAAAPTDAGSYTVKALIAEGTNHTAATAAREFVITKAEAPTITYPAASGLSYGETLSASSLTGGTTTYGSFAWEDGSTVPTVTNNGYPVAFKPNAATLKNYETIVDLTQSVSVTVTKATPAINLTSKVSGHSSSRQAILTATLIKAGNGEMPTGTVKFVDTTSGTDMDIAEEMTVNIEDGVVVYTWIGLAGQTYKVKAVYSGSDNYNTATSREVSFDTRKQNQKNFAVADIGTKTYGDSAFTLAAAGGNGSGKVSFVSSDPAIVSISGSTATIRKAGNVMITATKEEDDDYNEASAEASLFVNKKAISFIANDEPNVVRGSEMPAFTYKQVTLAADDSIITEPTITTNATDTNTLGKFVIAISGAEITNADSYTMTYVNGEMTIVEQLYTVTVNDGTGGGRYSEGQTVSITANDKNEYTFTGWSSTIGVTFASSTKATTFVMPGKDVTVTANYRKNTDSMGNSGGSTTDAPAAVSQTGDLSDIVLWITLLLTSLSTAGVLTWQRKKRNRLQE